MSDHDATQQFLESLPELAAGQKFRFACHPGVPCFNACCSDLNLMLTPYDVLRLRRALGYSSREFIQNHAVVGMAPDTGFPLFRLRMCDDARKRCPFVSDKGCTVYPNRPAACRTYPLGRATRKDENGNVAERFFIVREPHCKGFEEHSDWASAEWLNDQGLAAYNACNDRYMGLLARQKERGCAIASGQTNMAALALYQLDNFLDFIKGTGVLDRLEMPEERKAAVLADEEARLDFAIDWLELVLFGSTDSITVKGR
ncbi:hypothetical protein GGQ74_002454 [Desulfobaculum xiamenense]|uniref:YkgJ family cysteine cluster protein n=1 Tax=Desulfobaculum xiamenense TaxID=995050 RepID=A0A846QKY6_9BACT|nr:YkgJ family cysteine cluster protein [Desulfobaculum xiamenense]NJB68781.1 hypothetical protein [Desulfobaculum xiamenense]